MLKSLRLRNFKSYKDSLFEFGPGLNAIVGRSQSGKTNALQGLRFALENRPLSGKILSNTVGTASNVIVDVEFDDCDISLLKNIQITDGKKIVNKAEFKINGKEYSFPKQSIPSELPSFANMDDINYQKQIDMSYLITDTHGEIAKKINQITNIEKADEWTESVNKKIRASNGKIKFINENIEKKNIQLLKYKKLDEIELGIKKADVIKTEIAKKLSMIERVRKYIERIVSLNAKISSIKPVIERIEKTIGKSEGLYKKASKIEYETLILKGFLSVLDTIDIYKELKEYTESKLETIDKKSIEFDEMIEYVEMLSGFVEICEYIDNIKNEISGESKILSELYAEEKICPFCNSELTNKKIKELVNELCSNK